MKSLPIIAVFCLASASTGLAQGCCSASGGNKAGCPMAGHAGSSGHNHGAAQAGADVDSSASRHVFPQPVQTVFDSYLKIEANLAQDSLEGVASTAKDMAKAIRGDPMKLLPAKVAEQAEALILAKDLTAARATFKPLSELLIKYVKDHKVPAGTYYEAYCPMAKASWLQADKTILNPYMGKDMVHCGELRG